MTLDEDRQERSEHLVSRCDMSIEDIKSEIDFILGQPKREWVDLTDEELSQIRAKIKHCGFPMNNREYVTAVQEETQARLKEKNT